MCMVLFRKMFNDKPIFFKEIKKLLCFCTFSEIFFSIENETRKWTKSPLRHRINHESTHTNTRTEERICADCCFSPRVGCSADVFCCLFAVHLIELMTSHVQILAHKNWHIVNLLYNKQLNHKYWNTSWRDEHIFKEMPNPFKALCQRWADEHHSMMTKGSSQQRRMWTEFSV